MYSIEFNRSVRRDFKHINRSNILFIQDSLKEFAKNFSNSYELSLMQKGKIKKLKGQIEELYRLRLRSYRVIYKKYNDRLVILVLHITTRENAYR